MTERSGAIDGAMLGYLGSGAVHGLYGKHAIEHARWGRTMRRPLILLAAIWCALGIAWLPTFTNWNLGATTSYGLTNPAVTPGSNILAIIFMVIFEVTISDLVVVIVWTNVMNISTWFFRRNHPQEAVSHRHGHYVTLQEARAHFDDVTWTIQQFVPNAMVMGAFTAFDPNLGTGTGAGMAIAQLQSLQAEQNYWRSAGLAIQAGQIVAVEETEPYRVHPWLAFFASYLIFFAVALGAYYLTYRG